MIKNLLTAFQAIIFYILIIIPAEYFLTEKFHTFKYINASTKTIIFLIIFTLVFLINHFLVKNIKNWSFITLLFILSLAGYWKYDQYYERLQLIPTIYSISSDWTIQGKSITIKGKNFGDPHDQSKVKAGDVEFMIKKWTHQEIIASQPITNDYGKKKIYVVRQNGKISNKLDFEIRDPADFGY